MIVKAIALTIARNVGSYPLDNEPVSVCGFGYKRGEDGEQPLGNFEICLHGFVIDAVRRFSTAAGFSF